MTRELRRIERVLAWVASELIRPPGLDANAVRAMLAARRLRDECFRPAIGEVGWVLLLDAFAARLEGRGVAMTAIGAPAGIPRSTAHRWAAHLLDRGLLVRLADEGDKRGGPVALSAAAAESVRAYLDAALKLSRLVP
ncbi:MAG TPA: helix-turn-helix domain-containing protein [Allosphingosinicella sp.]|nr:helix-turn-helix domain-containing protein [Allosphingosinicella sp.]